MGKEFLKINGNVKEKLIRVTGNIQLLKDYLKANKDKLSASEIEHLNYRIEVMEEINKLSENNLKEINKRKALIAPVERKDGTIELVHIHQDNLQNTWNGCWSVSLQLLLQSRGVRLTQEQIRSFRPDITDRKVADELKNEHMLNEDKKSIMDQKVDLVMKVLPNTSMNMVTIDNTGNNTKRNLITAKKLITKALKEDCSPVSIVKNGHFRTIVGIKGDEILLKDSIQFRTHGANHTYKISLKELISGTKDNLSLYWLHDLSVEKDGKCREFDGLDGVSYKDGKLDYKESVKIAKGQMHSQKRGLTAEYLKHDTASMETECFRIEDRNLENSSGGYGSYAMHLPKNIVSIEPRKIRKFTEAEIELIDKLKEREGLEDIQMRLNTPDENGLYPAMTEKDLQDLNTAYQNVSDMYAKILNDKNTKITKKQKEYLQELKERTDREKEILSHIQKSADGVLPAYRDALRQGERAKAPDKTPYQIKEQSLQKLQEKFAKIDEKRHSNSKEYTEMIRSAKQLQVVLEAVSNPEKWKTIGIERIPDEKETYFLLKKAENAALEAVDTYIREKGNPFTQFGKNRLAAAKELKAELKKSIHLFREEKMDDMMKEQARLKAELSKIKPPFSSEELKTLRDKFEPETPMYDAGSKAMAALDMLGGMKYRMDQSKIEPDKKRMKDSILKVMAFTILGGREITDPEKQNMFSAQYYNAVIEGLENANVFEGRSQEEWFSILEKKEGVPTLKQVCADFKEERLMFHKEKVKQEQINKKIDDSVKNQYMIYFPEKINFAEHENVNISDYVKNMNSVKDAKFDINIPSELKLSKKEVALLTLLELATVEVGKHYRDPQTSDDKMRMLGGVAFSLENTYNQREGDEKGIGKIIDKEREALSKVLNEFAKGNKEPMQKFLNEALYNFRVAMDAKSGLTEKTRFSLKIGSEICNMLENHPEMLPNPMNPEYMQMYKGVRECSKFLDEAAQAKIDLAEIDYNNLKDGPEREKLEDALSKITAQLLVSNETIKDWEKQHGEIEKIENEHMVTIQLEMEKEKMHFNQLKSEFEKERTLKMNEYVQKMNNVNLKEEQVATIQLKMEEEKMHFDQLESEFEQKRTSKMNEYVQKLNNVNKLELELYQQPQIITNMNPDTKKELLQRIKETDSFKKAVEYISNEKNMREKFLLNHDDFMKDMVKEIEKKNPDISKNLSVPEKNSKEEIKTEMIEEAPELA